MKITQIKCTEKKEFIKLIISSILALTVYITCIVGSTYAWFNLSTTTSVNQIATSTYSITPTLTLNETVISPENGTYKLEKNQVYNLSINTNGTSSSGYVLIDIQGKKLPTEKTTPLPNKNLNIIIVPKEDIEIKLSTVWVMKKSITPEILNSKNYEYKDGSIKELTDEEVEAIILANKELQESEIVKKVEDTISNVQTIIDEVTVKDTTPQDNNETEKTKPTEEQPVTSETEKELVGPIQEEQTVEEQPTIELPGISKEKDTTSFFQLNKNNNLN